LREHPTLLRRCTLQACLLCVGLFAALPLCGCLVAGYSSGSGFWVWPGSLVITALLILFFLLRRGR